MGSYVMMHDFFFYYILLGWIGVGLLFFVEIFILLFTICTR